MWFLATQEISLIAWQQNQWAPYPGFRSLQKKILFGIVQIWLKWTRKMLISANLSINSKLNYK